MVRIENIWFSYGDQPLFKGLNLKLKEGEVLLLTGPNGSGKSTLLRLLAGVLRPDRGRIVFPPSFGKQPRKRIGFIPDSLSLYESFTVEEAIKFHAGFWEDARPDLSLLERAGVRREQRVRELSRGQRVLLYLTLVLSTRPSLLLVDEVIQSIDPYLRELFLSRLIEELAERPFTVVMVNLTFHSIESLVTRVVLLRDGEIILDEDVESLKRRTRKVIGRVEQPLPVLFRFAREGVEEHFIYPYREDMRERIKGEVVAPDLEEILKAFIGGSYV